MHSPTHAFLLMPCFRKYREGWSGEGLENTWIRNQVVLPCKQFYEKQLLERIEQEALVDMLSRKFPKPLQKSFKKCFSEFSHHMTPSQFRNHMLSTLKSHIEFQPGCTNHFSRTHLS